MGANERWADKSVESMYDKTLLALEIAAIKKRLRTGQFVVDAGCGEGEGTAQYADVAFVSAFDKSPERLDMARERVGSDVCLFQHDVRERIPIGMAVDAVISQRLLINLASWAEQERALDNLTAILRPGGRLILSEGSQEGVTELNVWRAIYGLPPIPIPAHNVFLSDGDLLEYTDSHGFDLQAWDDFGAYYLLTRGVQPALREDFHWDSPFNRASASPRIKELFVDTDRFSRIKVWVFERERL